MKLKRVLLLLILFCTMAKFEVDTCAPFDYGYDNLFLYSLPNLYCTFPIQFSALLGIRHIAYLFNLYHVLIGFS